MKIRNLAAIGAILLARGASAIFDSGGFDNSNFDPNNFDFGGAPQTTVPNVVGLTTAAADTALMGASLISGTISPQCSTSTVNLVLTQAPPAASSADVGSAVNMTTSTGVACPPAPSQRNQGNTSPGVGIGL